MTILEVTHIEDCFDGSSIKELVFAEAVTRQFIEQLGTIGALEFFPEFPRPFYRVQHPGAFTLKGIEGAKTARLTLFSGTMPEVLLSYISQFTAGHEAPVGQQTI